MTAPLAAFRLVLASAVVLLATALALSARAGPIALRAHLAPHADGPFPTGGGTSPHGRGPDKPDMPPIGRYETDEGGVFIFDRSAPRPLLKFEDDPEIWVLQPAPGPRGDVIYRNDLGEEMLRATSLGGMTVFTEKRPGGSPAALDGASPPLRLPPLSPAGLVSRFYQASVRASRAGQHQIGFETREDAEAVTATALADAAVVASEALVDLSAAPNGKGLLARINDVVIAQGGKPNAAMQKGVLTVTIVAAQGVFGRPSSRKIEWAAGAR
jgi:Domain of unknown function (DUF4908)